MFASFKSRQHTKTIFVPKVRLFSISLLVCEFSLHRQTWYQKFLWTYPPLVSADGFYINISTHHKIDQSNITVISMNNSD